MEKEERENNRGRSIKPTSACPDLSSGGEGAWPVSSTAIAMELRHIGRTLMELPVKYDVTMETSQK